MCSASGSENSGVWPSPSPSATSVASNPFYSPTSSPAPTTTSSSAFAFATLSPGVTMLPGLGLGLGSDNGDDDEKQRALLERRRKQRDLKRKSRARKKNDVESMKEEVKQLEAKYEQLCAVTAAGGGGYASAASSHTPTQTLAPDATSAASSNSTRAALLEQYTHVRDEMAALRAQIAAMKERLTEYDLFSSAMESYMGEFAAAPTLSDPLLREQPDPFEPLTDETCYAIIQACCHQIFAPQWHGTRMSTGAQLFGWRDERFVDGTTLQFALTKQFENLSTDHLMRKTWAIVTTAEHMHTIQKTTIGVKVLQVINDDIIVTQRCVHHPQLQRIVCVNLLMFRLRTERGYVVAYVTIDHPSPPSSPTAASATRSFAGSTGSSKRTGGGTNATYFDIDKLTGDGTERDDDKPTVAWVDTLQYFIFEDERPSPSPAHQVASPAEDTLSGGFVWREPGDAMEMEEDEVDSLLGFAASLLDEPQLSPPGGAATAAAASFSAGFDAVTLPRVNVTYGGRMTIKDARYTSYFLVEVLSMILRWDQAVAYSSLTFFAHDDKSASTT